MNRKCVKIANKIVGDGYPCFIIAEIGINHNGSVNLAKKMIDIAITTGCDAVKFQKRTIDVVYTKEEFEKNVHSSNDFVILADGFDQYADEDCDLTWYLLLVEKALYTKKIDRLEDTIADALLRKLKKCPEEGWPKDLLNTITDILISPKISKDSFDQYAIKAGKKIKKMLD